MTRTAFLDEAVIVVSGGRGGDGSASFRRTKRNPRGGPDGGDGGDGGNVHARADHSLGALQEYVANRCFCAGHGGNGSANKRHGENGENLYLPMPIGTDIYEAETGFCHTSLMSDGQCVKLAGGGQGGRGNVTFKSSTNQAPRQRDRGKKGEERTFKLALRLLADVGIIGMPNAGKSTFLNLVTGADTKTGDYPFTTLTPQLGVVELPDFEQLTLADLPGIVEGAANGAGLGSRFLRHASRTKILLHFIDASDGKDTEVMAKMEVLLDEMGKSEEPGLRDKPQVLVLTKTELLGHDALDALLKAVRKSSRSSHVSAISSHTGKGVRELMALSATMAKETGHAS